MRSRKQEVFDLMGATRGQKEDRMVYSQGAVDDARPKAEGRSSRRRRFEVRLWKESRVKKLAVVTKNFVGGGEETKVRGREETGNFG